MVNRLKFGKKFPFSISISDGHNEDYEYFKTEVSARMRFETLKETETDMHLLEFNPNIDEGVYEVIDGYLDEENANN